MSGKLTAKKERRANCRLKVGDTVMVLSGGNSKKDRVMKNQTGKILKILADKDRVVVEGLNVVKRHKKAMRQGEPAGIISKEGSIHLSNVMYYHEASKKPVRLKVKTLGDGRKVRGFLNPETKQFEELSV